MNELQKIELDIFNAVRDVIDRYGYTYYALGGTLLGAVRHQGFIPWDDDIDIVIPRPQYDELRQTLPACLPKHLEVSTYNSNQEKPLTYCLQVKDKSTRVRLDCAAKTQFTSLWIDVFPLDAMPTNKALRLLQKYVLLYKRMKVQFSQYEEYANQHRAKRPLHEKALMKLCEKTRMGSSWDPASLYREMEKCTKKYNFEKEDWFVNLMGAYKFKEMFPKSWFGEGIELPFEDTSIVCPAEYDKVLTQMYGDYMTPPPEEQKHDQHRTTLISTDGTMLQACKEE